MAFWPLPRRIMAVELTSSAVQHLTRGNVAETEELLRAVPPEAARTGTVARAVATIRALMALYEGRLEESVGYATTAIEGRLGLLTRSFESGQIAAAHAVRGLAHAALGNVDHAKEDADAAETSVHATPEVIARARIVRALVVSRAAYHDEAFRAFLLANNRLVLEHAMPRERALFRALRSMARSPRRSVYREPGRVGGDQAPSKLASWIAHIAPEAAPYIEGDRMVADPIDDEMIASGVPSDVRALTKARAGASVARHPARRAGRVIVLWALLVVLFLAIWQLLMPASTAPQLGWMASTSLSLSPFVLPAVLVIVVVSLARRKERALALARRLIAMGERNRALPVLATLAEDGNGMIAATAGLELARAAAQDGNFVEAISRCDAAIARAQPLRMAASDLLLPALMTESAVATAARGGVEDADAELAVLGRDFPTYPHLHAAQLRVKLMRAVRAGDRNAACAAARARTTELPFPYREDVLADLVLASRQEVTDADMERLEGELKDDHDLRRWIDAVAPGLRDDRTIQERRQRIATEIVRVAEPELPAEDQDDTDPLQASN